MDENSEEKGKEGNNVTAGLMLGSGLDKGDRGDREAKDGGSKSKQESEDVHEDQLEQKRLSGAGAAAGGGWGWQRHVSLFR